MQKGFYLDFEEVIADLEARIASMRSLAQANGVDVSKAVASLEKKVKKLTQETFDNLTRWQRVQLSRHPNRPYSLDYIQAWCSPFVELHGDRLYGDDKAVVGGFGRIDGEVYMLIGQQKGRNTKERQYRNFGMSHPEGYRKALRLMKLAEKFDKPVVTLIDTPGAYPGLGAEERGQGQAIAYNMQEMLKLRVPVLCVVIGEGASGGAVAIGVGDKVLMMENTWYSVISPESCSSILWRSWKYKEQAAEALQLTPTDMLKHKLIDGIISEPLGGAHKDPAGAVRLVREGVLKEMKLLRQKRPEARIKRRIDKFSAMGQFREDKPKSLSKPKASPKKKKS